MEWLLDELEADSALRVLWLAHQRELLTQALHRFEASARSRPTAFSRKARAIYSEGSTLSTLAEDDLDVALVTIQSLGVSFASNKQKQRALERYMRRPLIVVVDEAHHAGAPMYRRVLEDLLASRAHRALVGLTATPFPTSVASRFHLQDKFGRAPLFAVGEDELISTGILARPVLHSFSTDLEMTLNTEERRAATKADLPPTALARLDTQLRNELIVRTFADATDRWGKTLVFAPRIDHADALDELLRQVAPTKALHSEVASGREEILDWFRSVDPPAVLVSVGMLTEGVDLPDATTAFLCRPTASRVLLKQMVGRVLRGPRAGGQSEAHVVDFRDRWMNFAEILDPAEVIPHATLRPAAGSDLPARPLPDIVDDHGEALPLDVGTAVGRMYEAGAMAELLDDDDEDEYAEPPIDAVLVSARLSGYWQLVDRRIPVFDHQEEPFRRLHDAVLAGSLRGRPSMSFFDDSHPPYPTSRMVADFVAHVREWEAFPPFMSFDAVVGPGVAADRIMAAGAITEDRRAEIVSECYATTLARVAYSSLERFEEAVEQEIRQRRRQTTRLEPERPVVVTAASKRPLPRADRDLDEIWKEMQGVAEVLLPRPVAQRWIKDPSLKWTDRITTSTYAHWSITLHGKAAGLQVIRVNRLLRAPEKHVPGQMLMYLLYHELLHSLLPGQGHDAEFRELESRWPDAPRLDAWFDTLHERWETRPEKYRVH